MTSAPIDGSEDGKVVQLRAVDAGTETRTVEAAGPAYTDLSDGRPARKPIVPAHWRTWEAAREHVRLAAARHGHAAAYHGIRAPAYLVLTAWWALVGVVRTVGHLLAWWHVPALHVAGAPGRSGRAAVRPPADPQGREGNPHRPRADPRSGARSAWWPRWSSSPKPPRGHGSCWP